VKCFTALSLVALLRKSEDAKGEEEVGSLKVAVFSKGRGVSPSHPLASGQGGERILELN
jgi:hypothetical protein